MAGASNSHAIRSLIAHYDSDSDGSSDTSNADEPATMAVTAAAANVSHSQGEVKMSVDTTSPASSSRSPLPLPSDVNQVSNDVQEVTNKSSNCKALGNEDEFIHDDEDIEDVPSDPISFHRTLIGIPLDQIKIPKEPRGLPDIEVIEKLGKLRERKAIKNMDMKYEIQRRKDFRNPSIYEKLIDHCGISEFGSNFPPEIFNPAGFNESSFFDQLSTAQKILMDKLSKESSDQSTEKSSTSSKTSSTSASSLNKPTATVEIVTGTAKRPASFVATSSSSSSSNVNHSSSSSSSSSSKRKRRSKWDEGPSVRTSTSNKV